MSDEEDDFVTYGNALDPLDEENLPRKKAVTIEEQFAYDDQGRRRFHGAFTGGFSAGYFNTVGSRDGWRPQQFKSTRTNKSGGVVQRPEDFMDEEDTGEFGIAPTAIRATQEYSDETHKGRKRERAKQDSTGPIPGTPVLRELLKPVRERVGVMLLKKMGWKPGQGVGPRLTKKEKKHQRKQRERIKMYGCSLPNQQVQADESESGSSDDEFAVITFAPDDYEPFRCNPKDNYFGIGYSGLDRRSVLSQHINLFDAPTFSVQDKNKKLSIKGQAFGVGAFETEDDDIYARDDMSRYDFALGPERKSESRWAKKDEPKHRCIEGFVPAKEQLPQKKVFIAPTLPRDFKPIHKIRKSRFSPLVQEQSNVRKRYEMNAESRAKIINDDRPSIIDSSKAEPKSSSVAAKLITRTLNLHGKERIAEREKLEQSQSKKGSMTWLDKLSATTFVKGGTIGNDPKIQGNLQSVNTFESVQLQEGIDQELGEGANLTRPFFADLEKQRRFEQFLLFSEGERKLKFPSVQPLSMTEWDRDREVEEFEKAASLCERIDKARKNEDRIKEQEGKLETKVDMESLKPEDRMTAAAQMKMYGKLTRITEEWKPAKLVCVRFNIAEPSVGVAEDDKKKKRISIFDSIAWNEVSKFEAGKKLEYECEPGPSTSSGIYREEDAKAREEPSLSEEELKLTKKEKAFEESYKKVFKKDENEEKDVEVIGTKKTELDEATTSSNVQEKKDLYKSIFLSSSEDEDSENEESKTVDEERLKAALIGKSAAEMNAQRNTSPPRGIFANVDLDSLMKRSDKPDISKNTVKEDVEVQEKEVLEAIMEAEDNLPADAYGPVLPKAIAPIPEISKSVFACGLSKKSSDADDGKWVEKSRDKKKSKKEKKKHKHKERSRSKSRSRSRKKSKKEKRH